MVREAWEPDPQADLSQATSLPVAVMVGSVGGEAVERRQWRLMGVVAGGQFACERVERAQVRSGPDGDLFLWRGFRLRLRPHQADDYALNLGSEMPRVFVVVRFDPQQGLRPVEVTVSLDEAQNLDGTELRRADEEVLSVAMPAEVGRWVEAFVNAHYRPRRRKARGKKRSKALYDAEVGDYVGEER